MANTEPCLDNPILFKKYGEKLKKNGAIKVLPFAATTKQLKGKDLVDINNLKNYVIGFSDDGHGIDSIEIFKNLAKSLDNSNKIISVHSQNMEKSKNKVMITKQAAKRLGYTNWYLGSYETKQVNQQLKILQNYNVWYHVSHVSLKKTLKLINKYKKFNLKISCGVTPHHLLLNSDYIKENNGCYKVNPPLRTAKNQQLLIKALQNNQIGCNWIWSRPSS